MELITEILKYTCAAVLLWNAYILLFNRGVPSIKTAPPMRKVIIERLKIEYAKKAKNNQDFIIYDLGSGPGIFTREIAKAIPEAKVIGLEIAEFSLFKSNLYRKLFKIKNLEYRKTDFFKEDLKDAGAIVFFLTAYEMAPLAKALKDNTKKNTLIISNRFCLKEPWEPIETLEADTLHFKQGKAFVYKA